MGEESTVAFFVFFKAYEVITQTALSEYGKILSYLYKYAI